MSVIVTTLGFCNWQTVSYSWSRLYPKYIQPGWKHYFVDNYYPLRRSQNRRVIEAMCQSLGITILDIGGDYGASENFNRGMKMCDGFNAEYIVGVDPDAFVESRDKPETFQRAIDLMNANPEIAWVSLELPCTRPNIQSGYLRGEMKTCMNTGLLYFQPTSTDMMDVTVWRGSFLKKVGGLRQSWAYYGGVEGPMTRFLKEHGMRYVYLMDHISGCNKDFVDQEYVDYKAHHLSQHNAFNGSFQEWLQSKRTT